MSDRIRAVVYLSSVPQMVENGESLLGLAAKNPDQERTLAACASLVLAAAIDQGTLTALSNAIACIGPSNCLSLSELQDAPVRQRAVKLPSILTEGKLELNKQAIEVRHLHDLITLRNDLMHVVEEPTVLILDAPNDLGQVPIQLDLPTPSTRWLSVTVQRAKQFHAAVELYAEEVLYPALGTLRRGKLLTPVIGRTGSSR